jgi:5'-nucleotidase
MKRLPTWLAGSTLLALLLALAGCASAPPAPAEPVRLRILAINDFHGNLKPPAGGWRIPDPANPGKTVNVPSGGAEAMATMLDALRAEAPNHVFVAAGDLVGATPLLSSLFRDEPTIEAMNLMGMAVAAMGNHELDRGSAEILRLQNGGCHPTDGCKGPQAFAGARFQYLAANTVVQASGQTLFPPYWIKTFQGIPVAFIGLTLKGTPAVVVPSGVAGLRFGGEVDTVNALVPELQRQGVQAIVLLIHEGGLPSGEFNECPGISGPIVDIVKRLPKAVDLVVSGHTHRAYNCIIDGRPVTSAGAYGTLLTTIDLVLDPATRDVTSARAENRVVATAQFAPHPRLTELIASYEQLSRPLARRPVSRLGAPFLTRANSAGESSLGNLIADAQLAATRRPEDGGAEVALMNPGGVRAPLGGEGLLDITYEDIFAVQPFHNQLMTLTLTGEQLMQTLERSLSGSRTRPLHHSRGLIYTWDAARPSGQRLLRSSLRLNGQPVTPDMTLRVTVNAFMADGGDDLGPLRQGLDRRPGADDLDAFEAYLKANAGIEPDPVPRVMRVN